MLAVLGALDASQPALTKADTDCFEVTREIRALKATVLGLKSSLAKAAPNATADLERQIAEAEARIDARSNDLASCWYTLHIHAVKVTDSCAGQRAAAIEPDQVAMWVARANEVYAGAGLRFEFDPTPKTGDWALLNSTDVNDLTGELPGDVKWERGRAVGYDLAARYPQKVLVLFRHGPDTGPTGGGFSGTRYNFAVLPGFSVTTACGAQNIDLFAHELGHYFGLHHTFVEFKTKAQAAEALRKAKNRPSAFDGDGLAETPPEPYIVDLGCARDTTVTLNGVPFSLLRDNVMSYYHNDTKRLTPEQIKVVRTWVERRFADAVDGVGPYVPDERRSYSIVSAETGKALEVAGSSKAGGAKVVPGDWNGGANQAWKFVPLVAGDTGSFEIVSLGSGKCLTVDGAAGGAALTQWDWEGKDEQKWRLVQDESGELLIQTKIGRKLLAVPSESKTKVVQIQDAAAKGAEYQRWRLVPQD